MGLQYFKTCSAVNSKKWLKSWTLWFLELYFYLKYICNKDNIWHGETLPGVLLKKKKIKHFKLMKKSIVAAQKCKKILLQAALKHFWLSTNLKLKKSNLSKCSFLQDSTEENARVGGSRELLLFSSDLKHCSKVSFQREPWLWRSANLWKPWKSFDGVMKSSDHFLGHSSTMTSIHMNQQWLNSLECCT